MFFVRYNKNETSVPHSSTYFQDLSHRHNVILMGDSLGDLQMSKGVEPPSTILTIGFLNDKVLSPTLLFHHNVLERAFNHSLFDSYLVKQPDSRTPGKVLHWIRHCSCRWSNYENTSFPPQCNCFNGRLNKSFVSLVQRNKQRKSLVRSTMNFIQIINAAITREKKM